MRTAIFSEKNKVYFFVLILLKSEQLNIFVQGLSLYMNNRAISMCDIHALLNVNYWI